MRSQLRDADYALDQRLLSDRDSKNYAFKCSSCMNQTDKSLPSEDLKIPTFKCCSCNKGIRNIEGDYEALLKKISVEENGKDEGFDDTDPDYKVFLEHLREDEKSYVFEMKHVIIKYEKPEELIADKKEKGSLLNKFSDEEPRGVSKGDSDPRNGDSHPMSRSLFLEEDFKHETEPSIVDDTYITFLKMLNTNGNILTIESDCGIITYGEDNEMSSDSEEDTPYSKIPKRKLSASPKTCGSHTDDDDRDSVQSLTCLNTPCEYEDKLRKLLNMRYGENELRVKYDEASTRKQLERHRDLRTRAMSYQTDQMRPSYLDHHPDLKHMVNMALQNKNVVRALSLLRCLFFYLENVSSEGGFIPWKRPSVLKMIRDLDDKLQS